MFPSMVFLNVFQVVLSFCLLLVNIGIQCGLVLAVNSMADQDPLHSLWIGVLRSQRLEDQAYERFDRKDLWRNVWWFFLVGGFKQFFLFSIIYIFLNVNPDWLVVWNIFYFPFHIWDNPSHWRTHIFQDGYCTTNLLKSRTTGESSQGILYNYIYIYLGPVDEFWLIFSWKATMTWESIGPRIWSQGEGWDGHHATSVGCEYGNPKKRFNCSIWGLLKVVLGFDNSIFHHL